MNGNISPVKGHTTIEMPTKVKIMLGEANIYFDRLLSISSFLLLSFSWNNSSIDIVDQKKLKKVFSDVSLVENDGQINP